MPTLTVGSNSYGTLTEADTYLDGSSRAASTWLGVAPDDKRRALISAFRQIEAQRLTGTATGVEIVATVAVAAGGTGYAKNDVLTVSGGTAGEAAQVQVTAVASGVVTSVSLLHAGTYTDSDTPSSPASTTGGSGSGCTLTLTFTDQTAHFPATGLVDCYGTALADDTYPTALKHGQFELAYEISQNTALELASGTGSNIKAVGAGSARVEYFRPTGDAQRWPVPAQELLRCFLAGGSGATTIGGVRGGADGVSVFGEWPTGYDLTGGY